MKSSEQVIGQTEDLRNVNLVGDGEEDCDGCGEGGKAFHVGENNVSILIDHF